MQVRNMLEELSDTALRDYIVRTVETLRQLQNESDRRRKHLRGDAWMCDAGKWWGMSSQGISGPWNNETAAHYAADDEFPKAQKANIR